MSDEDCVENNLVQNSDFEWSAIDSDVSLRSTVSSEDGLHYVGKNKKTISKVHRKFKSSRSRYHYINTKLPGVETETTLAFRSDTWNLLITNVIIEEIVRCVNIYLERIQGHFSHIRED